MNRDPVFNPATYDWNHVFVHYCDGTSFTGTGTWECTARRVFAKVRSPAACVATGPLPTPKHVAHRGQ